MNSAITYLTDPDPIFEKLYLEVRKKEGRSFPEEEIRLLPELPKGHPLHNEFQLRKRNAIRFAGYVHCKGEQLNILELGCGNGWFSNFLSKHCKPGKMAAMDVNEFELRQAAKTFQNSTISWIYGDIFTASISDPPFDIIVLNASVQYFKDLDKLTVRLNELLSPGGEMHFMDTVFYGSERERVAAQKRTREYYTQLGFPEMADHYFHHCINEPGKVDVMQQPSASKNMFSKLSGGIADPFHWIRIGKR